MKCGYCQKLIPSDADFCCYCGKRATKPEPLITPPVDNLPEENQVENNEPSWGMHVNCDVYSKKKDIPGWLKPIQRDSWKSRGVIIWDRDSHQVARLWASHALQYLEQLRTTEDWKEDGIVVGEPAIQITISSRKHKADRAEQEAQHNGKWVLTNQIQLSGIQTQELYEFLQEKVNELIEVSERDKEDRNRRLLAIYKMLLGDDFFA